MGSLPKIIGVTGTTASGKSTVANAFRDLGAEVIDADAVGHQVLSLPDVREQLCRVWGDSILLGDGSIDRSKLASLVFGCDEQVRKLNAIVHPVILARIQERVAALRAEQTGGAVVLDAPLLVESGLHRACEVVVVVDADRRTREARVARARNWSEDELARREASQATASEKRAAAHYVIDNAGTLAEVSAQVQRIWEAEIG